MTIQEVAKTPEPGDERAVKITVLQNNWQLIEVGAWSVSLGPDANIMLPRSLRPQDADDFCAAVREAAKIGLEVKAANEERAKGDDRSRLSRRAIVKEGGVPDGAHRMPTQPHSNAPKSSIGRRGGQRRASQVPRGSQAVPSPQVPAPRQPRGRR
jgi:uncharacterized protein YbjT (DUF2867 family)